ncbi:uncharacterized protein F5147DRAFT_776926 [Suillus discolor]|uniref:Uncharacterized protein n=1 Tax=Suillus discolor TaxID=1912936 RepID=A0A9P7JRD2_9AGAM|nr:uncharacterized protein F5147DRAFT_776926 [Suillus discolor]KAG2100720.1 hypothetical protein F5147DRAFT_776926 [Suillus discolor]
MSAPSSFVSPNMISAFTSLMSDTIPMLTLLMPNMAAAILLPCPSHNRTNIYVLFDENKLCFDQNLYTSNKTETFSDSLIPPIASLPDEPSKDKFVHAIDPDEEEPLLLASNDESIQILTFYNILNIILNEADIANANENMSIPSSAAVLTPPPTDTQDSIDVFLIYPSFDDKSTYANLTFTLPFSAFLVALPNSNVSLPRDNEYAPSLMPSHPFKGDLKFNYCLSPL